ncbi:MAG: hypothetical protein RB191_18800, partial [Terriglobia bacterium]|nr:hypothetical protein [Terriglobia bacterium]
CSQFEAAGVSMKINEGKIQVEYYCPACRKRITRLVARRERVRESMCGVTGRDVQMKLLKKHWYARRVKS